MGKYNFSDLNEAPNSPEEIAISGQDKSFTWWLLAWLKNRMT